MKGRTVMEKRLAGPFIVQQWDTSTMLWKDVHARKFATLASGDSWKIQLKGISARVIVRTETVIFRHYRTEN